MKFINIKEHPAYLREYFSICISEWGVVDENYGSKLNEKVEKILNKKDDKLIAAIGLVDLELIGFISLLKSDGNFRTDLTPWYGTMYIKEEYRGLGYSKLLNDEILDVASKLGFDRVHLKTDLVNYYEKFGAIFIEKLTNGENLYYLKVGAKSE